MSKPLPYIIKIEDTLESIAAKLGIAPDEVIEYHNKNSNTKTNIKNFTLEGEILLTPPQEEIEVFQDQRAQQEEAKKEEKAEEEKKQQENARSEHDKKHFVVHKAKCFCDQSQVHKKPATLLVTTHDKVILNDQEGKFFATEADKTFDPASATFGNCLKQPTSGGYKPCTLTPAPKWDKTFDKTKVYGKTVLTEISTLQCVAFGGKIEVLTHGQTDSVMTEHAENTDPAELALIDPALNMPPEKIKYPSVSSITLKKLENNPDFKAVSSAEKKAVEKIMVRPNQECTFEAKVKEGNIALTSWVIYDGFTGDKYKKLLTKEQVGTSFKNSFSALGKYRIEGYGKPKKEEYKNGTHNKNYPDCSIDVEVVLNKLEGDSLQTIGGEDFAKVVGGKMRLRQNFPASFKPKFLLPATEEELERLNMYVTDEAGSIIDSVKVNNTVSFTPKNKKATYHIKAEYRTESGEVQTQSFTGETINNMISAITSKFEKIRPGTPMSFKVTESTFSLYIPDENSDIANEIRNIKWNLDGRLMGTGYEITIPGHDLMTKGPHVVEAFVNLSNAHGQISKDEADDWRFEVLDNDVKRFVYDLEPKVGKTTRLNANLLIFPDLLANEQIQWKTTVPHKTIDERTIAITPTLPGIQKVNCNINGQAGKTLTINVRQAKITDMLFTDNNGIEIQKASWGQTVNIWIKQEYLVGEVLIIEVWDKDKTSPNDVVEIINKKYDGGLIPFELSPVVKQKTGDWGNLFLKIGAMHLTMPVFNTNDILEVQNKREIYAAHIGSQDGKERYYQTDYDQVCCFYAKSRGIKETEELIVAIRDGDKEILVFTGVHADKSGLIKVNLDWNKIKQKLKMRKVHAVVKNNKNEIIYDGSDLATGFVNIYKKAALLKLAEYKSAVWVEKTESALKDNKNGVCECEERIRAFLRMLRVGEGTGELINSRDKETGKIIYISHDFDKGYTTAFGGNHIANLNDHPRINYGGSSAAGAYQVMPATWDDNMYAKNKILYKINSFSKENQDKFSVLLMKHHPGCSDLLNILLSGQTEKSIRGIASRIWASLPEKGDNSRYLFKGEPQPVTPMKTVLEHYEKFLKEELAGNSPLYLKKGFLKEFNIKCNCGNNSAGSSDWHHPLDRMELRGWYASGFYPGDSDHGYGPDARHRNHDGLDLYAPIGTTIYACIDGIITYKEDREGYGHRIFLEGNYNGHKYFLMYCHLSEYVIGEVKAGDPIGKTGQSGNASGQAAKMNHLHFEVRKEKMTKPTFNLLTEIPELGRDIITNPDRNTQTGN